MFGRNTKGPIWVQKSHFLKADEYICSACGYKNGKAVKICPGCKAEIGGVKHESSWVDEAEAIDIFLGDD